MTGHLMRLWLLAWFMLCTLSALPFQAGAADASAPALHERMDRLIDSGQVGPPVAVTGDAEFLRRLSLDLTGMPPSPEELRDFLADTAADKRARAIDRLLEGPLHARHLATTLDVMLMERRPSQNVTAGEWQNYLLAAARENRPVNRLLKEILSADGADAKLRPTARFYLDRGSEPNLITRDVGRIVFGRDMQCAQCHNHPLIEDYQQSDYHGLLAFYAPAYVLSRKEGGKDRAFYAEKAGGDLSYDSVFVKDDQHRTGPRILGGTELDEPVFPPGEEYQVKPADNVLPVPRFSRRAQLAALATGGTNRAFNENIANRLWAMMMGKGLVHPLDLHHPANPPSNPELLTLLADEIVALDYDTRAVLRELALSKTCQRAIDLPVDQTDSSEGIASTLAELKTHTAALKAASEAAQNDYGQAIKAWHGAETASLPAATELDQALAKHTEASKKQADAQKAVDAILAQIAARQDVARALAEAAGKAQEAVKKLPNEKDLAAAAQKFADRSSAMSAELTALEKTGADKTAAVKKAAADVAATIKPVETARARALPLRNSVREKEQVVLAARGRMAECRLALEHHKMRLDLFQTYLKRRELGDQAAAAVRAIAARREAIVQAQKRSSDCAAVQMQRKEEVRLADQARRPVEVARNEAQAALDLQQKIVASVVEAFTATDAARQQLPDDPTLTEAAEKLKTKADELRSVTADLRSRLAVASEDVRKAVDAVASANRRLDASIKQKTETDAALVVVQNAAAGEASRLKALKSDMTVVSDELAALMSNNFAMAQLKPLTPEQMCWSMLKVTGVYDRSRQAVEAELSKAKPLTDEARNDPVQVRARALEVEERTFDKLKGNLPAFVTVYAAAAGQPQNDFFATPDQALFAANDGLINGWVAPAGGNIADRMIREQDSRKAAEDLYVTILTRAPSAEESADVVRILAEQAANKPAAVQELVWGLLTSAEFRFNH